MKFQMKIHVSSDGSGSDNDIDNANGFHDVDGGENQ